ncbi:MAG: polyprenyl synthetase family protein [Lachnospiraceae bacterium]|nr:polyprenyl synthetase family protein [Lachnospiraceae bacterium]
MSDIEIKIGKKSEEVFKIIEPFFPPEEGLQKRVCESMNYSLRAGGKRLRPLLMLESYKLFGGEDLSKIAPFLAAIEMIHTYSLIHDDLPAMDNDDYRRGKLTNHKMFDEPTAILAGDGLLNFAFETIGKAMAEEDDPILLKREAHANRILGKKAGIYGMIGGQTVDIESEHKKDVDLDTILFIHKNKTAALIEASLMIGAVMAGADEESIRKIEEIGENVGLAFQIQDDILDVIGNSEILGKNVGSDAQNEKVTYVTLKGIDVSMNDQKAMSEKALNILDELNGKDTFLAEIISFLVTRNK